MTDHERDADWWSEAAPPAEPEPQPEPHPEPTPPPVQPVAGVPFPLVALAALAAAAAGAMAWGLVVRWTGYEAGIVAWGIGIVVGFVVRGSAGGRPGAALRALAVVASLLGIALGKYLSFALVVQGDLGVPAAVFSREMVDLFRESLAQLFGLYDLLWAGLAVASAWYMLRPVPVAGAPTAAERREAERRRHSRNPVDRLTAGLPHGWRVTIDWMVTIVGAVAIVLAVKAWVINPYRIPSSSMEPTLHCARPAAGCEASFSDRVLANRFIYHFTEPERGDIVVFETPPAAVQRCGAGGTFVKRLIGLPGETLEIRLIRGNGYVFVNGKQLKEPYVMPQRRDLGPELPQRKIPAGHYFMMGDNRSQSCDSRAWGSVPRENIIGKVFATYWPPQRISLR